MKRDIRDFHYRDAHFHIHTDAWDAVTTAIIEERRELEAFIRRFPAFETSLYPLVFSSSELNQAPLSVLRMQEASLLAGLGPMAGVAGTMAQLAAEESRRRGSAESIVENGGDLYLDCKSEVTLGLFTGDNQRFGSLALRIPPDMMPLAVCSSSGRMGHSFSLGDSDVVTVFSENASLADAAATLGGNLVVSDDSIEPALNVLMEISGVSGCLIIRDDRFGSVGKIPEIVRSYDSRLSEKVSRDDSSNFPLI